MLVATEANPADLYLFLNFDEDFKHETRFRGFDRFCCLSACSQVSGIYFRPTEEATTPHNVQNKRLCETVFLNYMRKNPYILFC